MIDRNFVGRFFILVIFLLNVYNMYLGRDVLRLLLPICSL
jgi:hypothetical protein